MFAQCTFVFRYFLKDDKWIYVAGFRAICLLFIYNIIFEICFAVLTFTKRDFFEHSGELIVKRLIIALSFCTTYFDLWALEQFAPWLQNNKYAFEAFENSTIPNKHAIHDNNAIVLDPQIDQDAKQQHMQRFMQEDANDNGDNYQNLGQRERIKSWGGGSSPTRKKGAR